MGGRGIEYCILSPKSRRSSEIAICSYFFSLCHLSFLSCPGWQYAHSSGGFFWIAQANVLACLFPIQTICQAEGIPPEGRTQEASFSTGVPVNLRWRQNWIGNNFILTVKSDCKNSTCCWVQFVRILLRISLLHFQMTLGSFSFLGCHYMFAIWWVILVSKRRWEVFYFLFVDFEGSGIGSSLIMW